MWTAAYSPAWSTRRISARRRRLAPRPGWARRTGRLAGSGAGGTGILGPLGGEQAEPGQCDRDQGVPSCHAEAEEAPRHRVAVDRLLDRGRAHGQGGKAFEADVAPAGAG